MTNEPIDLMQQLGRSRPPKIISHISGNKTIITNWSDILKYLNADKTRKKHVHKYLAHETGTSAKDKHPKLVLGAKVSTSKLNRLLEEYMDEYFICGKCYKPDTVLIKEKRQYILRCQACGNIERFKT